MGRLAFLCCLVALPLDGTQPAVPPLPRDNLPEKLDLEAIPVGLDGQRAVPQDNPLSEAKVQLGRKLFFDPLLSADRTIACASCHDPAHGFASPQPRAVGVGGKQGKRNAPSLFNRAYGLSFFWDGREATLESQALRPIEDPLEMGASLPEVVTRLQSHADYRARFQAVFPDGVTAANIGKALASFERTLLLGNSQVDRFRLGEITALSESEKHGMWLFESRGRCWRCHAGPNFTDEQYHNTGVSWGKSPADWGRYEVTREEDDRGRFKTPSLRGVADTAPYMHDGSLKTLEEVVEFYNQGGGKNPSLDAALAPLQLTRDEAKNLVSFLKALSALPPGEDGAGGKSK
jgi:cytochrome c peroxidase